MSSSKLSRLNLSSKAVISSLKVPGDVEERRNSVATVFGIWFIKQALLEKGSPSEDKWR